MNSWELILSSDFGGAPRIAWNRVVEAVPGFAPFLLPAGTLAANIWCPQCGCCHRVIPNQQRKKVKAVCQCDQSTCDDIELDFKDAALATVDVQKLVSAMAAVIPVTPRVSSLGNPPAWRLGEVIRRSDGVSAVLIACFTGKGHAIRNAALAVAKGGGGPTLFVCCTTDPEGVEALLPPSSRVVGFDDLWSWDDGDVAPGGSARRLISGWPEEPIAQSETAWHTCATMAPGYVFEKRGQKKVRVAKLPFTLTLWRCRMNERTFDLPDIVGSELLVRILLQRGQEFHADALLRSLTGEAVTVVQDSEADWVGSEDDATGSKRFSPDARQEILSTEDIAKLQKDIRGLKKQIVDCGDYPGSAGEKAKLEERYEDLLDYLKKNTRPCQNGKRAPKVFSDSLTKAANLLGKHIREVLTQLRGIDAEMHKHLSDRGVLKFGQTCLYNAETGFPWQKK